MGGEIKVELIGNKERESLSPVRFITVSKMLYKVVLNGPRLRRKKVEQSPEKLEKFVE